MAILYSPKIVTNGLVLCLDAGNKKSYPGNGTVWRDLSGNENNATLLGGVTYSSTDGGRMVFDGVDDYISTNRIASQFGVYDNSYTFSCWVNPQVLTGDKTLFGTDNAAIRIGLHLVFRGTTIYQGHYSEDYGAGSVTTNQWYNITYTYDKATGAPSIYKNAIIQTGGTYNSSTGNSIASFLGTDTINIGRWDTADYFNGYGSVYMIYNRLLTASEVTQNFNATRNRFGV